MNTFPIYSKRLLKTISSYLIVTVIFLYLIRILYRSWVEVAAYDFHLRLDNLVLSFIMLLFFLGLRVFCWKMVLKKMEVALSMRTCLRIAFLSMMAKYLPGKVWMVMGKIYLSKNEGVPGNRAFASIVLEIVFEMSSCLLFFFFFLWSWMEQPLLSTKIIYGLAGVLLGSLFFLYPGVFYNVINFMLRLLKREELVPIMRYTDVIHLFALYFMVMLVQGVAFYFFVNALCSLPLDHFWGLAGSIAIAGVLGTLSIFAPSGLGVREGTLALLLTTYVIPPVAVLISLLARLWVVLGEIMCALVAWKL